MNCALLKDDCYVDDIKSKIPVWLAEGYKALLYNRNIWDWLKCNFRAHAKHLQEKYSKAKTEFGGDPNNLNVDILNFTKKK